MDVIEEGFDAVVRTGAPADSRLSARRLGAFGYLLVASPGYLAQRGTPRVPEDLLQHSCLHYRYPTAASWSPGCCGAQRARPSCSCPPP